MSVEVIIAGAIVILVIAIGIGWGLRRAIDWFSSIRQIAAQPPEVHIVINQSGSVLLFIYRKPARSFQFLPINGTRTVTITSSAGAPFAVTTNPVVANNGLAVVTVSGIIVGSGTLTAAIASAQPGRRYGPIDIPVHVYNAVVPPGVTQTPVIQQIVGLTGSGDGGEDE